MVAPLDERLALVRSLIWDYDIPAGEALEVLEGTREMAGHYTGETLFRKLLESYRWFTVLKILPPERILELLTDDVIQKLRVKSLSDRYTFVRDELARTFQVTG